MYLREARVKPERSFLVIRALPPASTCGLRVGGVAGGEEGGWAGGPPSTSFQRSQHYRIAQLASIPAKVTVEGCALRVRRGRAGGCLTRAGVQVLS